MKFCQCISSKILPAAQFVCFLRCCLRSGSSINKLLLFLHSLLGFAVTVLHSCTIRTTDREQGTKSVLTILCVFMLFLIWVANTRVIPTDYLYSSLNFVSVLAVSLMWHSDICLSLLRTRQSLRSHQRFLRSWTTIITVLEFFLDDFCANKWLLCFWLKFLVCQR